jgi:excisionase family DNA binding protein
MSHLSSETLFTVAEAAERLACCEETVRRMIRSKRIGIGGRGENGRLLVRPDEVASLVTRRRGRPPSLSEEEAWHQLLVNEGLQEPDDDDQQEDEDGYPGNPRPPLVLNRLSADGWNLLNGTILSPAFDKSLHHYLLFKRLQVEGLSWRQAAAKTELSAASGRKWAAFEFIDVIHSRVQARAAKQQRGEATREMPRPSAEWIWIKPGPKALPRPALTDEEERRSWQLLAQVVEEEEAAEAIRLAVDGELMGNEVPLVADVHRFALLGLCTAEISLLVGRTRRRIQQLRKQDPTAALRWAFHSHKGAPEREARRQRRREAEAAIRSYRGFENHDDLTPEQFRNLPDYSKKYRLPVHRPESDTVTLSENS